MRFPSLSANKKEIPVALLDIEHDPSVRTVIVCNVIDQFSLLAAYTLSCFFKDALLRTSVKIMDIRDPLIMGDDYYFVGIGEYENYRRHVTNSVFFTAREIKIVENMDRVVNLSKDPGVTTHPRIFDPKFPDPRVCPPSEPSTHNALLFVLNFMEKYGSASLPPLFNQTPFYQNNFFANLFDSTAMEKPDNQRHYTAIDTAFAEYFYAGTAGSEKQFRELPSVYDSNARNFNARMSDRLQLITVGGIYHYHMNAVNPDVFGSIRRFNTAKKPFVHITHGAYGTVICYRSSAVANSELGKNYPNALMIAI